MPAILALFTRSLREDIRSKSLLWTRIGISSAIFFSIFITRMSALSGGAPGLYFFSSVVWMNFVFICIAGISYFATPITEEKEEGTLGLLRMTDLSPLAILFGKSTSRFLGGSLILLVQVPFVMLSITLGGVHLDQVIASYLVLGSFLFFACNVGLLGSVLARRTGTAAVAAGIIGVTYQCWPYFLAAGADSILRPNSPGIDALRSIVLGNMPVFYTPVPLGQILTSTGAIPPITSHVLTLLIGGFVAFLLSRVLFERFADDQETSAATQRPKRKLRTLVTQSGSGRCWNDAIAWRDFHYIHGGRRGIVIKSCLYIGIAIWIGSETLSIRGTGDWSTFSSIVFFMSLWVACFESLFATSRIFRLERKSKTLSGLYLLPQSMDDLIAAKRRAVTYSLVPILFFVAISGIMTVPALLSELRGDAFMWAVFAFIYFVAQLFLNHYLVALFSLRVRWGGLPLALGLSWIANSLSMTFAVLLFREAALILMPIISIMVAVVIRNAFRTRLTAVIAEE